jgi:hypothetical protein
MLVFCCDEIGGFGMAARMGALQSHISSTPERGHRAFRGPRLRDVGHPFSCLCLIRKSGCCFATIRTHFVRAGPSTSLRSAQDDIGVGYQAVVGFGLDG